MSESQTGFPAILVQLDDRRGLWPVARLRQAIAGWRARLEERRQLLCLDERMLRDIGLSKLDIWQEASKPFWRP